MEALPLEIRRIVMEHLSNAELLTISLVNKAFNFEARTLLKDRVNWNADLEGQNVQPFMSNLAKMNVIPFSGIKIQWHDDEQQAMCPKKKLAPASLAILDRVPWKLLSVKMHGGKYVPKKCPALQVVQKILQDSSEVLEQLELNNHLKLFPFIQQTIQDRIFPQLKILKLEGFTEEWFCYGEEIVKSFVKEMLARAPNLQEFHQDNLPDWFENLDRLFCGIFPEELAQLKEQDDEFLRAIHIVPVMPSFICLRGLRTFKLTLNSRHCHNHPLRAPTTPVFSKVTALIAFQRCPNLSVKIRAPSYERTALNHLRPYASFGNNY